MANFSSEIHIKYLCENSIFYWNTIQNRIFKRPEFYRINFFRLDYRDSFSLISPFVTNFSPSFSVCKRNWSEELPKCFLTYTHFKSGENIYTIPFYFMSPLRCLNIVFHRTIFPSNINIYYTLKQIFRTENVKLFRPFQYFTFVSELHKTSILLIFIE